MAIRPGPIARFSGLIGATCLALFSASAPAAAPASGTASFEWDLTDLYPSTAAWSEALEHTHDAAQHLEMYRGTLGQNAAALLSALDALSAVRKDSARI